MYLEHLLQMDGGYVLSFTNSTFQNFVRGSTGEDIYSEQYGDEGSSKANRLRSFWNNGSDEQVAQLLNDLRTLMLDRGYFSDDSHDATRMKGIIGSLGGVSDKTTKEPLPETTAPPLEYRAFVSYAVEKKVAGAAVKSVLSGFGYDCFLAHNDLRVSEEWQQRILDELKVADLFVALLSEEFIASKWCSQELGFIVSRPEVLVVPLSLDGTMPYGFVGHLQGSRVNKENLASVLEEVMFRERPRRMIGNQIEEVRNAASFRKGEAAVRPLLPHFAKFTDDEVDAFAVAAAGNYEVWDAGRCASEYIPAFLRVNGTRMSRDATESLRSVLPHLNYPEDPNINH